MQHKAAAGAETAISKMEQRKPGSAKKGTIRVTGDQVEETRKRARGRARVSGSDITTEQLNSTLDSGLDELSKKGIAATSRVRATAKGACKAGATSAAIGGVTEMRELAHGNIDAKGFAANRARDAGEAAVATTVGSVAERFGKATVGGKAVAQGAARSAVVTVAVSSLRDVPSLARGEMSFRDFSENRGMTRPRPLRRPR